MPRLPASTRLPARGLFVTFASLGIIAAGCGTSGRDLREPEPNAVSPSRATESTAPTADRSPAAGGTAVSVPDLSIKVSSTAFNSGSAIPAEFSCDGPSPDLSWSGVPAGTAQVALIVVDTDANNFVHWMVTGLPGGDGSVTKGAVPAGGIELPNSRNSIKWTGPCPPAGQTHTYNFLVLGLAEAVTIPEGTKPTDAFTLLLDKSNGTVGAISGTYTGT